MIWLGCWSNDESTSIFGKHKMRMANPQLVVKVVKFVIYSTMFFVR